MYWLDEYKDDFEGIVDLVWLVYKRQEATPRQEHLQKLYCDLTSVEYLYPREFTLAREDVSQELAAIWIQQGKRYFEKPARITPIRQFLLDASIYHIRVWFHREIRCMSHFLPDPYTPFEETVHEFNLDVKFLRDGSNYWPLSKLSPYERYLLFLKFKQDKNIVEIAYIVQKHREVVSRQLTKIMAKLRRLINENQNPRRPSVPGHGLSSDRGDSVCETSRNRAATHQVSG